MSSAMTNKMFGKSLLGVLDGSEVFVDCFSQELKKDNKYYKDCRLS